MYLGGADELAFSTGGAVRLAIRTIDLATTVPIRTNSGTATAPGHSFVSDTNTGLYSTGSTLGISVSGTSRATFGMQDVRLSKPAAGIGTVTACWATTSSGTVQIGECTSSKRFKENIKDLPDSESEKIYSLRPVKYRMKIGDKQEDYGFIAEEAKDHLPLLVPTSKDGDGNIQYDTVNYRSMTALLVKEMQKLKARIEVLEAQ